MWRCCSFLFFLTHRFSSKNIKWNHPQNLIPPEVITSTMSILTQIAGPSIHSPIKEVSILAGLLLLCLLPLPHRRPSTCRLCPPCQPRLCALSCSQVDIEVPSSWNMNGSDFCSSVSSFLMKDFYCNLLQRPLLWTLLLATPCLVPGHKFLSSLPLSLRYPSHSTL